MSMMTLGDLHARNDPTKGREALEARTPREWCRGGWHGLQCERLVGAGGRKRCVDFAFYFRDLRAHTSPRACPSRFTHFTVKLLFTPKILAPSAPIFSRVGERSNTGLSSLQHAASPHRRKYICPRCPQSAPTCPFSSKGDGSMETSWRQATPRANFWWNLTTRMRCRHGSASDSHGGAFVRILRQRPLLRVQGRSPRRRRRHHHIQHQCCQRRRRQQFRLHLRHLHQRLYHRSL